MKCDSEWCATLGVHRSHSKEMACGQIQRHSENDLSEAQPANRKYKSQKKKYVFE